MSSFLYDASSCCRSSAPEKYLSAVAFCCSPSTESRPFISLTIGRPTYYKHKQYDLNNSTLIANERLRNPSSKISRRTSVLLIIHSLHQRHHFERGSAVMHDCAVIREHAFSYPPYQNPWPIKMKMIRIAYVC